MSLPTPPKTPVTHILFVCDTEPVGAVAALQACASLCQALAGVGLAPLLLRAWAAGQPGAGHAAKIQQHPYAVYCSREVRAEAALLALLEQPSVAITLGHDPVALAQPLLASGVACVAWIVDEAGLRAFPSGPLDRRLGLAAAGGALAQRLSVLTGRPVATLLPPLSGVPGFAADGEAVLVPASRAIDGVLRVLEMAAARPDYRFKLLSDGGDAASLPVGLAQLPNNVSLVDRGAGPYKGRVALLPALSGDLPWGALAQCLAAGIAVLGSTEPLLQDSLGDAGLLLPATAPLDTWLAALDRLMRDDSGRDNMRQRALRRSTTLRLEPAAAAQNCVQLLERHLESCGHLLAGRI